MRLSTLFDVVCALHLTFYVKSQFEERGGVLFVAPPGAFKTTALELLEFYHPGALVQTDMTTQQLTKLRDRIAEGQVRTLVLTDYQKVYERNPATALNVEGTVRALVAEGFTSASFEDAEVNRLKARALLLGAITPGFHSQMAGRWRATGFSRRFIFPLWVMDDADVLLESVVRDQLIDLGRGVIDVPRNRTIPMNATETERRRLVELLKYQEGGTVPLQLMCKTLSVLKWHYGGNGLGSRRAMETIEDFATTLQKGGGRLRIDLPIRQERRAGR